jgi:hypothetical protein
MSAKNSNAVVPTMRVLLIVALACACLATFSPATYRYHEFFSGVTLGVLLVATLVSFRIPLK